jgi:hypothetical protein
VNRRVAAGVALACVLSVAHAYNEDPDADQVFPAWSAPELAAPVAGFNPWNVFCEIHPGPMHTAEIHLRNMSADTLHFAWWIGGYQRPGDNARVTLRPYLETRQEVKLAAVLRHARPGLTSSKLRIYDLRRGPADEGPADAALHAEPEAPPAGEDWMPACVLHDDSVVRRANLLTRVVVADGVQRVVFRNLSARDLHFRYDVPALGTRDLPRLEVRAGADVAVAVPGHAPRKPLPRVNVCDVRIGADTGKLYAEDRSADAGWFPLATSDASDPLPHDALLAIVEPAGADAARVRFRSHLRTQVRLRFVLPAYQSSACENDAVTVEPGADAETIVALDRDGGARVALAHLRVFEVSHKDAQ